MFGRRNPHADGGGDLERRVTALEEAVQENRALNVRLAELTDVVSELLLPVAARDEALGAYGDVDRERLHALEVEAELAELEYARQWLPEWLYVPQDVLPFVVEDRP